MDRKLKFIDSLVYDNLRNMEPYKTDLGNLQDRLSQENIQCNKYQI